jgi:sortase (surface protein transpeptidase)
VRKAAGKGTEVQHMRSVRRFLYFFAFIMTLILYGCGSASYASQPKQQHAASPTARLVTKPSPGPSLILIRKVNPIRLLIPAIGVNAAIETVGVTPDGDLAVPKQNPWIDVGWYASGSLPGEQGSAVIDGHLDRPGGYPAVFWRLRDLQTGDEVRVIDAVGKTLRFHVTGIAFYSPQNAPIQEIFGNDSGDFLNLITCAGDWIPSQHQTTLRLVVYTSLD